MGWLVRMSFLSSVYIVFMATETPNQALQPTLAVAMIRSNYERVVDVSKARLRHRAAELISLDDRPQCR